MDRQLQDLHMYYSNLSSDTDNNSQIFKSAEKQYTTQHDLLQLKAVRIPPPCSHIATY